MKTLLLALLLAAPDPHEILTELEGDYVLTSRFWTSPSTDPLVSTLPARRRIVLNGRALQLHVGPPAHDARGFLGAGLMGYDETKKQFWYVWTDTSTSGRAVLQGSLDEDGRGVLEGETPTPYGYAPLRVEIRKDGSAEIHEYYGPGEDGATYKWLELRYERRD